MITILLVEDHATFRQALGGVVADEPDMQVVTQAATVDEATEAAETVRPTVAVVDLDLTGKSGVDAIANIRRASPTTGCIVLSALSDDIEFGRAIEAGASAILHKSVDISELLQVIRTVAAGGTILPPGETSRRLQALASSRRREWYAQVLAEQLTPRERQVLQYLAQGADKLQIAEELHISPGYSQDAHPQPVGKIECQLASGSRHRGATTQTGRPTPEIASSPRRQRGRTSGRRISLALPEIMTRW